jgi:flagellin-like protein
MHVRHLRNESRGLTPVVGIILMISITVLLAATVGAFVMGLEDEGVQQTAPTVAIQFDYDAADGGSGSDSLNIIHDTGGGLDPAQTYVTVNDARCDGGGDDPNGQYEAKDDFGEHQRIGAGMSMRVSSSLPAATLCSSGDLRLEQATVHVVWRAVDGTASNTMATWYGPDASY